MTIDMTKTWFVDGQIIEETIPEAEIYKREWVGLTDGEISEAIGAEPDDIYLADFRKVEAKLKEKNSA